MLIDAHTHAFLEQDLPVMTERLTLLDSSLPDGDPNKWLLRAEATLEGLVAAMERAGVARYVLLALTANPRRVGDMNRWAALAAAQYPAIVPFGTLHPAGDVAGDLAELLELGLAGVKLHPFVQRFNLDDPVVHDLLGRVEAAGLPVLLDTVGLKALARHKPHLGWLGEQLGIEGCTPDQVARAAKAHPGLRIIAAHLGGLYDWDGLAGLMELDNIYLDIAYVNGLVDDAKVVEIIRAKGPERVLYGTDCPWREPVAFRRWFEALPLTEAERAQVAAGTASQLLGLADAP